MMFLPHPEIRGKLHLDRPLSSVEDNDDSKQRNA